jgi:hypothetical protein
VGWGGRKKKTKDVTNRGEVKLISLTLIKKKQYK